MRLESIAVQEAHLWEIMPSPRGRIIVQHPNGASLTITQAPRHWLIRRTSSSTLYNCIARVPKTRRISGFAGVVQDTLDVVGPDVQARMDQLLLDIRIWAVLQPQHGDSICLLRTERMIYFYTTQARRPLPPALHERLTLLQDVMIYDPRAWVFNAQSRILLELPTTAHGVLALQAQRTRSDS